MVKAAKPEILFITAWWPREYSPPEGIFIKEHALALAKHANLHIVHLRFHSALRDLIPRTTVRQENTKAGPVYYIDIYSRIRRFGLHDRLIRQAYTDVIQQIRNQHYISGVHLNVRTHITRLVTDLECTAKLPFVYTEHFSYYHRGINLKPPKERATETTLMKLWLNDRRLRSIMTVSNELAQTLRTRFDAPAHKLVVIQNVASPVFQLTAYVPGSSLRIVAAASWGGPKKPMLLIEALAKLPEKLQREIELIIAGEGEYFSEMKAMAASIDRKFEVRFTGYLTKERLAKHVQKAAFFAHPTESENAPTVIAEALCCGTPVLSMSVNGIPEMVDQSNGRLVPPNDVKALQSAIEWMCAHHGEFDRKAIAERAQKIYSAEEVGKSLMREIRKML